MLVDAHEDILEYEKYSIDSVLEEVRALREVAPQESKAWDFYTTIEQTLIALSWTVLESKAMRRSYDKMVSRVEIMEKLISLYLKTKKE